MIFIERYPLKRGPGVVSNSLQVKSFVFLNITDLSEVAIMHVPLTAGPESVHIPKMVLIMFL